MSDRPSLNSTNMCMFSKLLSVTLALKSNSQASLRKLRIEFDMQWAKTDFPRYRFIDITCHFFFALLSVFSMEEFAILSTRRKMQQGNRTKSPTPFKNSLHHRYLNHLGEIGLALHASYADVVIEDIRASIELELYSNSIYYRMQTPQKI